jgi:hypothetical protein
LLKLIADSSYVLNLDTYKIGTAARFFSAKGKNMPNGWPALRLCYSKQRIWLFIPGTERNQSPDIDRQFPALR